MCEPDSPQSELIDRVDNFLGKLEERCKGKSPYEINVWNGLKNEILNEINMKLHQLALDNSSGDGSQTIDYAMYINHIYNQLYFLDLARFLRIKDNKPEDIMEFAFELMTGITTAESGLSARGKALICEYLDIIADDSYTLCPEGDFRTVWFAFQKVFIPIFFHWHASEITDVFAIVSEFNTLLDAVDLAYDQIISYGDLKEKLIKTIVEKEDTLLYGLVGFCERLSTAVVPAVVMPESYPDPAETGPPPPLYSPVDRPTSPWDFGSLPASSPAPMPAPTPASMPASAAAPAPAPMPASMPASMPAMAPKPKKSNKILVKGKRPKRKLTDGV